MSNHKEVAQAMALLRKSTPYHIYPNGGTVLALSMDMQSNLQSISSQVKDHEMLPPWVLMKLSQAQNAIDGVQSYVNYQNSRR